MLTLIHQLADNIGLEIETVGLLTLRKVIEQQMQHAGFHSIEDYHQHLAQSPQGWQSLIDAVVVPETWFMRGQAALHCLNDYVKKDWISQKNNAPLRILSVPCSTGEEPYSIAINLLEMGLNVERLHILGVDISQHAVQHAQRAIYTEEAFRDRNDMRYQQSYFERVLQNEKVSYHLYAFVKQCVHFKQANVVNARFLENEAPFDIIFCRNLLIYLNCAAREKLLQHLLRLLKPSGLLFVGHAERAHINPAQFEFLPYAGAFACRRLSAPVSSNSVISSPNLSSILVEQKPSLPTAKHFIATNQCDEIQAYSFSIFEQLFEKAQRLANQGDFKQALFYCQACLTEKNDSTEAYFLMAMIYLALNEFIQVEQYLNKTLYLNPTHQAALTHLILLAEKRGELQKTQQLRQRLQRVRERIA